MIRVDGYSPLVFLLRPSDDSQFQHRPPFPATTCGVSWPKRGRCDLSPEYGEYTPSTIPSGIRAAGRGAPQERCRSCCLAFSPWAQASYHNLTTRGSARSAGRGRSAPHGLIENAVDLDGLLRSNSPDDHSIGGLHFSLLASGGRKNGRCEAEDQHGTAPPHRQRPHNSIDPPRSGVARSKPGLRASAVPHTAAEAPGLISSANLAVPRLRVAAAGSQQLLVGASLNDPPT